MDCYLRDQGGSRITWCRRLYRRWLRANHTGRTLGELKEYNVRTIFTPYLDALLSTQDEKFGKPTFALLLLHPKALREFSKEDFKMKLCKPVVTSI